MECGTNDPLRRFAVQLHPLYKSTMRSLMSSEDPDLVMGGSSIAKGKKEMVALSSMKALEPFTYIADD